MPLSSSKNAKSRSSEVFLLFSDAFVQVQSSTVSQCPLSVLWVDATEVNDDMYSSLVLFFYHSLSYFHWCRFL